MFFLPKDPGNTTRFIGPRSGSGTIWQPYTVPLGAIALMLLCAGPGGNGGQGFTRASGNGGGGGGGGSGGITRTIIPACLIPSTLYVGAGAGGNGVASFVSLMGGAQAQASTLITANGGSNGGNGALAAVGAAGAAATAVGSHGAYAALGAKDGSLGQIGGAGGAVAGGAGNSVSYGAVATGNFLCGGAGGAGTSTVDFQGGNITGSGFCPTIQGGNAGSFRGADGFELWLPPTFSGGAGGGSSNLLAGGTGGTGAPGCGGGGGGAGTTGGSGGLGGPGFVLITALF